MKIQIKEWKVKEMAFHIIEANTKQEDHEGAQNNSFNLDFGTILQKENKKEFGIGFLIDIRDDNFSLKAEMIFIFNTDSDLPSDFEGSHFLNINAPAIAYPYLRAFISNFTLQAGFPPVMLPSVNFVEFRNKEDNK